MNTENINDQKVEKVENTTENLNNSEENLSPTEIDTQEPTQTDQESDSENDSPDQDLPEEDEKLSDKEMNVGIFRRKLNKYKQYTAELESKLKELQSQSNSSPEFEERLKQLEQDLKARDQVISEKNKQYYFNKELSKYDIDESFIEDDNYIERLLEKEGFKYDPERGEIPNLGEGIEKLKKTRPKLFKETDSPVLTGYQPKADVSPTLSTSTWDPLTGVVKL